MLILNAFSLNMIRAEMAEISMQEISELEARFIVIGNDPTSGIGHADTAALFSTILGVPLAFNRASIALQSGDRVLVGQYSGPRLPEGCSTMPEGAKIRWIVVSVA